MKKCPCGGNVPENRNEWQALKSSGFGACYCSKSEQYFLQYENAGLTVKVEAGPPAPKDCKKRSPDKGKGWFVKTGLSLAELGDFFLNSDDCWEPVMGMAGWGVNGLFFITHLDCKKWDYSPSYSEFEWAWCDRRMVWLSREDADKAINSFIRAKRKVSYED